MHSFPKVQSREGLLGHFSSAQCARVSKRYNDLKVMGLTQLGKWRNTDTASSLTRSGEGITCLKVTESKPVSALSLICSELKAFSALMVTDVFVISSCRLWTLCGTSCGGHFKSDSRRSFSRFACSCAAKLVGWSEVLHSRIGGDPVSYTHLRAHET